jgi:hypothetical protein
MAAMQRGTTSDKSRKPVYALDPERLDLYWENIVPLLESIPMFAELFSPDWVYMQAKMGHLQLWALADTEVRAIVVTRISIFPRAKVFEIMGIAGSKAYSFVPEMEAMFEWLARDAGCTYFIATTREGVLRKLRQLPGIQRAGIVLMKKIIPSRAN